MADTENISAKPAAQSKPIHWRQSKVEIGDRFGRLTVIEEIGRKYGRNRLLRCSCECGGEKATTASVLKRGAAQSCGCLQRERTGESHLKHGDSAGGKQAAEYHTWTGMLARCYDPKSNGYKNYGGRGIQVCWRWRESYENFLADVGRKPTSTHSIDRIDNNGNYEPGNVRWATKTTQQRNQRSNKAVNFRGETHCVTEWAEITGLPKDAIYRRLKSGWTPERALTEPIDSTKAKKREIASGEAKEGSEAALMQCRRACGEMVGKERCETMTPEEAYKHYIATGETKFIFKKGKIAVRVEFYESDTGEVWLPAQKRRLLVQQFYDGWEAEVAR